MRDVATEELDSALRGRELARDDIEQGCLPRTVGSEDGATLASLNGELHVCHRPQAAEPPPDPPQVEDRRGGFGFLHLDVFACTASRLSEGDGHFVSNPRRRRLLGAGWVRPIGIWC